ncbi:MAG: DUF447 family protein [Theionarchaea archaeon]|nr:DUF447 family protein [Theionarchaea archaeon]
MSKSVNANPQSSQLHWQTAPELPPDIYTVWHKPNKALNPVAIIATVDFHGNPHTAPFGSVRAITSKKLRFITWHGHSTYSNLQNNNSVMVAMVSPPHSAVSVRGKASVIKDRMDTDDKYALIEIEIEEVKNDMVRRIVIETAITVSVKDEYKDWFDASLGEAEEP